MLSGEITGSSSGLTAISTEPDVLEIQPLTSVEESIVY